MLGLILAAHPPVGVAYKGWEPGVGFYLKHYCPMEFELPREGLAAGWPRL